MKSPTASAGPGVASRPPRPGSSSHRAWRHRAGWWLGATLLAGCRTVPSLPAVDLQAPGWEVRQGQAVWAATPEAEGVAGELFVATRADGACWVQFAKPPFTLATAHAEAGAWAVEPAASRRRLRGRGPAPQRWVWFALAAAVRAEPAGGDWRFHRSDPAHWGLTNAVTGESLAGYLTP